jgi:hypothetical protein
MIFKSKQAEEQRQRVILYKRVFGSPEGKEVLFDLCNRYHLLNGHKGDVHSEGQRSVVLWILNQAHVDMKALDELLKGENGE